MPIWEAWSFINASDYHTIFQHVYLCSKVILRILPCLCAKVFCLKGKSNSNIPVSTVIIWRTTEKCYGQMFEMIPYNNYGYMVMCQKWQPFDWDADCDVNWAGLTHQAKLENAGSDDDDLIYKNLIMMIFFIRVLIHTG